MVQQIRQPLDDIQPETQAGALRAPRICDLIELVEDLAEMRSLDPAARVPNFNPHRRSAPPTPTEDTAAIGISDSVGHQIGKNPLQQRFVGNDGATGCKEAQAQALFGSLMRKLYLQSLEDLPQLERRHPRHDLA